jgi:hypothetical protein
MPTSKREDYIFAANELEKLGTADAYRDAQKLKALAQYAPAESNPENARELATLRDSVAQHEANGRFAAAAPLKTRINLILNSSD